MTKSVFDVYLEICQPYLDGMSESVARSLFGAFGSRQASSISKDERDRILKLARINLRRAKSKPTDVEQLLKRLEVHLTAARTQGAFADIVPAKKSVGATPSRRRTTTASLGVKKARAESQPKTSEVKKFTISSTADVITARFAGLNTALTLGFRSFVATRIATVVSELSRNIALYAETGELTITELAQNNVQGIKIVASDNGPGIRDVDKILRGQYKSKTGLGIGLTAVRDLADEFDVQTGISGTRVMFIKWNT